MEAPYPHVDQKERLSRDAIPPPPSVCGIHTLTSESCYKIRNWFKQKTKYLLFGEIKIICFLSLFNRKKEIKTVYQKDGEIQE